MNLLEATDAEVAEATTAIGKLVEDLATSGVSALKSNKLGVDYLMRVVAGSATLKEAEKLVRIKRMIDMESNDNGKVG